METQDCFIMIISAKLINMYLIVTNIQAGIKPGVASLCKLDLFVSDQCQSSCKLLKTDHVGCPAALNVYVKFTDVVGMYYPGHKNCYS